MAEGIVKWFSEKKGYGFITPEGKQPNEDDVFVHYTQIPEGKTLEKGMKVRYELGEVKENTQNLVAVNVEIIEE